MNPGGFLVRSVENLPGVRRTHAVSREGEFNYGLQSGEPFSHARVGGASVTTFSGSGIVAGHALQVNFAASFNSCSQAPGRHVSTCALPSHRSISNTLLPLCHSSSRPRLGQCLIVKGPTRHTTIFLAPTKQVFPFERSTDIARSRKRNARSSVIILSLLSGQADELSWLASSIRRDSTTGGASAETCLVPRSNK